MLHKGFLLATKGRKAGRPKESEQRQMNGSACEKSACCVCLFMHTVCTNVFVCFRMICLACTLCSIKAMFGLINHDIARSLRGGRSVTCPRQLLFTFCCCCAEHYVGFMVSLHHHFGAQSFALGSKCMAVNVCRHLG